MSEFLVFEKLNKTYFTPKGPAVIVDDFNLTVKKGEFISIIGHSGCGKSTVLSMVAGLNDINGGHIFLKNREVVGPGPDRGVVFQSPSLLPWMTAYQNVMLGVNQVFQHASKEDRDKIAKFFLYKVGLKDAIHRKAKDLSNGMKQRVGLARAFAIKPQLLLLDEPFGMLDSLTRIGLQEVLLDVWNKNKTTAIMITHDVDEAIFLSDRVIMMTSGPRAKVGDELIIDFPRPRIRSEIMESDMFFKYRAYLIDFLYGKEEARQKKNIGPKSKSKIAKVA